MFGAVRRRICRRLKNMSLRAGPEKHATDSDEAVDAHWKAPGPHSLQSTHGKLQRERGIYKPNDLEERRLKKERLKREAGISHDPRSESARALEKNSSDDVGKVAHKATSDGSAKEPLFQHERWMRDGVDDQDGDDDHAWRGNTEARRNLLAKARAASPFHRDSQQRHEAHAPQKRRNILCINNKHDPRLRDPQYTLGTSAQCISKGFGAALHQHIDDRREFVKRFDAPYEKIINLDHLLWFKNSEPPPGKHRATLPMAFQKGWGAGSAALARKLKANM